MVEPVKKRKKQLPPFQGAIEAVLEQYGAKDWAIIARGDNSKIVSGDVDEFRAAFWAAGTGDSTKKSFDDEAAGLILKDLEILKASILAFIVKP